MQISKSANQPLEKTSNMYSTKIKPYVRIADFVYLIDLVTSIPFLPCLSRRIKRNPMSQKQNKGKEGNRKIIFTQLNLLRKDLKVGQQQMGE